MINRLKESGEWEIQLTMNVSFMSTEDSNGTQLMYLISDNTEIMIGDET